MTTFHRLMFTADDDLDLGWMLLAVCAIFGLVAFGLESAGVWHVTKVAWAWFASFTTLCFIAGAARDRARLIAGSEAAKNPLSGILSSAAEALGAAPGEDPHMMPDHESPDPRAP